MLGFYMKQVPWSLTHPSSPELSKKSKTILLLITDKLFSVKAHPIQAETQLGTQAKLIAVFFKTDHAQEHLLPVVS